MVVGLVLVLVLILGIIFYIKLDSEKTEELKNEALGSNPLEIPIDSPTSEDDELKDGQIKKLIDSTEEVKKKVRRVYKKSSNQSE
jgi:hypothetical protein